MIKRTLAIFTLLCLALSSRAQQDPMYSHYVFNGLIINPAYAGTADALRASVLYRNQWANIPGSPKTGIFSVDSPIRNEKIGLGLTMSFDKIGVTSHSAINGIYSYRIKFKNSTLLFGLQAGVGFFTTDFSSVDYTDGNDPDVAFQTNYHDVLPNIGFGAWYYTGKFYAGFSVPQVAGYAIQKAIYNDTERANLDLANHYMLTAGYLFDISSDVKLKPSVLLKYVSGAPLEFDLNAIAWFYDLLALGVSYRSLASLNFISQFRVTDQLSLGYAYEYATTELNNFSNGSHEIMLQYLFSFSQKKVLTPRYF
jgi:type IX secretion system PorP/SprF family membrane protein